MTWADTDYAYKKKITIDHTKVAGDETDFPVLISVTDGDLADTDNGGHVESSSGYDIVFYNDDEDTLLSHEIESYTNTDGTLVFWVKVNSLSSTVDTVIYLYYGKRGVFANPSSTDTWDDNYVMVQHMYDDPDTSHVADSTSNANNGTKVGADNPLEADARIGKGQLFDNVDDRIASDGVIADVDLTTTGNVTMSGWFYRNNGTGLSFHGFNKWNTWTEFFLFRMEDAGVNVAMRHTALTPLAADATNYEGEWVYLVGVKTGDDVELFVNGVSKGKDTTTGLDGDIVPDSFDVGTAPKAAYHLGGYIDEYRISNISRCTDCIATEYNNQSSPSTFLSVGSETIPETICMRDCSLLLKTPSEYATYRFDDYDAGGEEWSTNPE